MGLLDLVCLLGLVGLGWCRVLNLAILGIIRLLNLIQKCFQMVIWSVMMQKIDTKGILIGSMTLIIRKSTVKLPSSMVLFQY